MTQLLHDETVADCYLALIRQRPLAPIVDDADYDSAASFMKQFDVEVERGEREPDDAEVAYFDVLTMLLEAYDDEFHPMPLSVYPKRLNDFFSETGQTDEQLALIASVGPDTLAAARKGGRALSYAAEDKLCRHFDLPAGYFRVGCEST
ncbi:MAG: hypothetical protein AAF743_10875 [Planctomycetota bacterium]